LIRGIIAAGKRSDCRTNARIVVILYYAYNTHRANPRGDPPIAAKVGGGTPPERLRSHINTTAVGGTDEKRGHHRTRNSANRVQQRKYPSTNIYSSQRLRGTIYNDISPIRTKYYNNIIIIIIIWNHHRQPHTRSHHEIGMYLVPVYSHISPPSHVPTCYIIIVYYVIIVVS